MEQKVFLDTSVICKLSFIDNHSNLSDEELKSIMLYSKEPTPKHARMHKNSIAVDKIIKLYHDIKEGRVEPCICSTVYCEVINNSREDEIAFEEKQKNAQAQGIELKKPQTIKQFLTKHFTLYLPESSFIKDYVAHVFTLQNSLKPNTVKIDDYFYGLNDEADHDGKRHSDYNDRTILSEMAVLSQYTDEKIRVVNFRTMTDEEGLIRYINKLNGKIGNEINKQQHGSYELYPTAKEIIYYHFNQADYGSRVKDDAFTEEAHKQATKLEDGIEDTLNKDTTENERLNIGVRHIAEYDREA